MNWIFANEEKFADLKVALPFFQKKGSTGVTYTRQNGTNVNPWWATLIAVSMFMQSPDLCSL